MELRHLESLVAVVEHGSLTAAAAHTHVSQPALTQQIQALEDELGEALLIRRPRGVEPTAAGRTVLEYAARLLAERDRLQDAFAHRKALQGGRVAFGIIPTMAPYLLPQWIGPFRARFPGVDIAISESRTEDLVRQVAEGEIEFAVLSDVAPAAKEKWSLQVRELFREPLLLALHPEHPLAQRKAPPETSELNPEELIHLSGGHCLSDRTLRLCRISDPNPALQCDQLSTALAMVAAGLGISIVPKIATKGLAQDGIVLRPFAGKGLHRVISLMKRRGSRNSPAAEKLLEFLKPPSVLSSSQG